MKAGTDPLAERQQEASQALASAQAAKVAGITFKAVAEAYIAANEESWRMPSIAPSGRIRSKPTLIPMIGDLPVAEVGTAHVLQILEPIWKAKGRDSGARSRPDRDHAR